MKIKVLINLNYSQMLTTEFTEIFTLAKGLY